MNMKYVKQSNIKRITDQCFDRDSEKASGIIKGILDAGSSRISDVSHAMEGASSESNYRSIHRFLDRNDPKESLHRLYDDESPYVIGDPTEIKRPQAKKTEYVGKLRGDVRGYWILLLATPRHGRAMPFNFVTYSSRTINSDSSSRNMEHRLLYFRSFCSNCHMPRKKCPFHAGLRRSDQFLPDPVNPHEISVYKKLRNYSLTYSFALFTQIGICHRKKCPFYAVLQRSEPISARSCKAA